MHERCLSIHLNRVCFYRFLFHSIEFLRRLPDLYTVPAIYCDVYRYENVNFQMKKFDNYSLSLSLSLSLSVLYFQFNSSVIWNSFLEYLFGFMYYIPLCMLLCGPKFEIKILYSCILTTCRCHKNRIKCFSVFFPKD